MSFDTVSNWLNQHQSITQMIVASGVLLLSLVSYFITKHYIIQAVSKLVEKTKTKLDDILLKKVMLRRLSFIVPLIVIYSFASVFPWVEDIIRKVTVALISFFVLLTIGTLHRTGVIEQQSQSERRVARAPRGSRPHGDSQQVPLLKERMDGLFQTAGNFFTVTWHRIAVVESVDEFFDANFCSFWPFAMRECRPGQFERNVANVQREGGKGFVLGAFFVETGGGGSFLCRRNLH